MFSYAGAFPPSGGKVIVNRKISLIALVIIVLSVAGCTSKVTKSTEKGLFSVDMLYKGEIRNGRNVADLRIRDSEGKPLEGAEIEVTPWMPEMGHGVPYVPTVTEKGGGLYNVVFHFTMTGRWELKMAIRKGDVEDNVVFEFPDVKEK
jgi:hypothetical protein